MHNRKVHIICSGVDATVGSDLWYYDCQFGIYNYFRKVHTGKLKRIKSQRRGKRNVCQAVHPVLQRKLKKWRCGLRKTVSCFPGHYFLCLSMLFKGKKTLIMNDMNLYSSV